ncbi:MAG: hypothetical protein ACLR7K_06900 [Subdoligranulum sp.]
MQNLKNSFASFWKYRYLLQNLITRDFKLKYRRSVLGVAWSVLNPLLTCLSCGLCSVRCSTSAGMALRISRCF